MRPVVRDQPPRVSLTTPRREEDAITAEEFIEKATWTFAKTMPDQPHEYAVKGRDPGISEAEFDEFVVFIVEHGYRERYGGRYYSYYEPGDGCRYWSMTGRPGYTTIINRAETHPSEETIAAAQAAAAAIAEQKRHKRNQLAMFAHAVRLRIRHAGLHLFHF